MDLPACCGLPTRSVALARAILSLPKFQERTELSIPFLSKPWQLDLDKQRNWYAYNSVLLVYELGTIVLYHTKRSKHFHERQDPIPVAFYARVSSDQQDFDLSVATQLQALRDYADKNGYFVAREYVDEMESGPTVDRP